MESEGEQEKIYIKCSRTHMRKGIDGISCVVAEWLGEGMLFDESAAFLLGASVNLQGLSQQWTLVHLPHNIYS